MGNKFMTKKIQWLRHAVQVVFTGLMIAGLYGNFRVFIQILLPTALVFGNFFCGWICSYGTIQEVFGALGSRIFKKKLQMPKSIQKYLQFTRYILWAIIALGIALEFFKIINSVRVWNNIFDFTTFNISLSIIIMFSFILISMIFERPFCNYLCPKGVDHGGAYSMVRLFTIKRDEMTCVDCGKCDKSCPMNISISDKKAIRNGQCINCFECISCCPVDRTLTYGFFKYNFPWGKKK